MIAGASPPDPFILSDNFTGLSYKVTAGLTVRSPTINPVLKTLVLIGAGQSQLADVGPTLYTPTNTSVIDQLNVYDGALYSVGGPLLGTTYNTSLAGLGPGNILARVADTLVTNGKFDRVIIAAVAVGSTKVTDWGDSTGTHRNRVPVVMRRLASIGITPTTTGVTFANVFSDGEDDNLAGTSQAAWTASFNNYVTLIQAAGFSGRIFVPQETWVNTVTSAPVRAAQAAAPNGSTIFSAGDFDTLNNTKRADTVHFNDTGAADVATLIYNGMHASGAPY